MSDEDTAAPGDTAAEVEDTGDTAEDTDDWNPDAPAVVGPQVGIRAPVGVGKTKRAIDQFRDMLAANPAARLAYFVPDHRLAAEAAARFQAALGPGVGVEIWRGIEQPDPTAPGKAMCQRVPEARAIVQAGGAVEDLCGGPRRKWQCPLYGVCAYHRQRQDVRAASAVVLPHANLPKKPPAAMRRYLPGPPGERRQEVPPVDLVVIDEAFHSAMRGGAGPRPEDVPLADLDPGHFTALAGTRAGSAVDTALARLCALATRTGPRVALAAGLLDAAGLRPDLVREARIGVMRHKIEVAQAVAAHTPGGDTEQDRAALEQTLAQAAPGNARVLAAARVLAVARGVLTGRYGPAALRVVSKGAGLALRLMWREDIHPDWLAAPGGVLHLDATMEPDLARVWLPGLAVTPTPPAQAKHMRVIQVRDKAVGHSAVVSGTQGPNGARAARNNAARVLRIILRLARLYVGKGAAGGPDVLAIMPKALEATLEPALPANVGTLHFGALRGQDAFKGVAAALVVSWQQPGAASVEDIAEVVFGVEVARLAPGAFYPKVPVSRVLADGTTAAAEAYRHRDPHAEIIRRSINEAELVQAVGRVRGVWRTASNPVAVFILTNAVLGDDVRPDRTLEVAREIRTAR